MITKLHYTVGNDILQDALLAVPEIEFKESINYPTGDFFYDPWQIKPEFRGTVWEKILSTLPVDIGEARIIILKGGVCYQSHGDIDDRYHLNIIGKYSYLINLDTQEMFPQRPDGCWYEMDAGPRHSAANFGNINRIQLVVRKLLNRNNILNPISIKLTYEGTNKDTARFIFDDTLSPWLNKSNKLGIINNFSYSHNLVKFNLESTYLDNLISILPNDFKLEIL